MKSGLKTTEFYQSLVYGIIGFVMLSGQVPIEDADMIQEYIMQVIGGIISLVSLIGYVSGRVSIKKEMIRSDTEPTMPTKPVSLENNIAG